MVNALAFSGSNYLFSMLRSSDLNEKRKRHDQAVEQLQAAQAKWSRKRTERLDWISEDVRRQGHAVQTFRDVDDAMREYSRSPEQNLTPWDLSPSCQTSTCRAVAKEIVRSPSLYWGSPRPAWWPTNSLSNCMQASIAYFFWPLVAKPTPGFACWRLIRLLEYLDEAVSHLLQSPRLLEGAHSHKKAGVCSKGD